MKSGYNSILGRIFSAATSILVLTIIVGASHLEGQETKPVSQGTSTLSVNTTYTNFSGGSFRDDSILLGVKYGRYFTDNIEVAVGVDGWWVSPKGSNADDFIFLDYEVTGRWYFNTDSTLHPFAGAHAGLAQFESGGSSDSRGRAGVQGGIRAFLGDSSRIALDAYLKHTRMGSSNDFVPDSTTQLITSLTWAF